MPGLVDLEVTRTLPTGAQELHSAVFFFFFLSKHLQARATESPHLFVSNVYRSEFCKILCQTSI